MRALLVLSVLFVGCAPTCERVCRKTLFECGDLDSERVALEECMVNCDRQEILYRQWDNDDLLDLFRDHRRCIGGATCEELEAGSCYDGYEELFVFDVDKTLPGQSMPEDTAAAIP